MTNQLSELLTINQASKLLNCHPNTLRLWEKKGIIKAVRFGIRKDRRYRKEDIQELLKENMPNIENIILPSSYDLTRIDMTGTYYEGLRADKLTEFKTYDDLGKQIIDRFDFQGFRRQYVSRIQPFPNQEMDQFATLPEKILHVITAGRYRNGSLETIRLDKHKAEFIRRIEYFISKNQPIKLMFPAFPFKIANPLKSSRGDADLAEVASFCRLDEINLQIQKYYKPGAQFYVFHDGHLYYQHFLHDLKDANRYFASMKRFVKKLGLEKVVILKDAFEELKTVKDFDKIYTEARKEMTNLWQSGKYSNDKVKRIIQSAHNNIKLSDIPYEVLYKINFAEEWDLTDEEKKLKKEIDQRAQKCAFEYMVVQHALEKANFFNEKVPNGIRLTVHPKEGHIGIYLVKRKTHLLPWMGVGVLKSNGEASVHYESELISNGRYNPVFIRGEKYPFYYQEASISYEGEREFRKLFDKITNSLTPDDFYWAFAFNSEYMDANVRKLLIDVHKRLAEKGVEDKAICRTEIYEMIKNTYQDNHNIKIISTTAEIPTGVIILKDRIINLLWGKRPSAYEINDKKVVERYQNYFKDIWGKND